MMHNRFQSYDSSQDINVLALVKGKERYIFLYDDASRAETLRIFGRFASNPELSFSWPDAAFLCQRMGLEWGKFESVQRIGGDISELTGGWDLDDIC